MKHTILLGLLSILLFNTAFSQRKKAVFKLKYQADFGFHSSRSLCGDLNHYQLKIKFPNSTDFTLFDHVNSFLVGKSDWDEVKMDSLYFYYDNPPSGYSYDWFFHRRSLIGCNGPTCADANGDGPAFTVNRSFDLCSDILSKISTINCDAVNAYANIQWVVTPFGLDSLLTQPFNDALPTNDNVSILAPIGYNTSFYNWEFTFSLTGTWQSFPSKFQNKDSISFNANDLIGQNVDEYIGKNIFVRINPSSCISGSSNILTYTITKSPPNIIALQTKSPRCYDSDDGKVLLTFDRPLVAGESIILNLKDSINNGLIYFQKITNKDLDTSNSYLFPDNLKPSKYYITFQSQFSIVGTSGSVVNSQSNIKQSSSFDITSPDVVSFTASKINVWCFDGKDGTININAFGGLGQYQYMIKRLGDSDSSWNNFSSSSQHTISNLAAKTWLLQIRDRNQCYAKSPDGKVITEKIVIEQPSTPLMNNKVLLVNPLSFGSSDGSVEVEISGGTPKLDGSYNFKWSSINGEYLNTNISFFKSNTGYRVKLYNIPDGNYILSTSDFNAINTSDNKGCIDVDTFFVRQPLPLKVNIEIKDSVFCKGDANGSLVAHVTGGVPFLLGKPYKYTWKKKDNTGAFIQLAINQDSIVSNLSSGWYALAIEDANGIMLSNDSIFYLPEPTSLTLEISHKNVTCSGLPNGTATALPNGGTPPYSYAWNTGEVSSKINNLVAGTYLVFVKDRNNCQVQQNVLVAQPNAVKAYFDKRQPICYNSCDGSLAAIVSGGTTPFKYSWKGSLSTLNTATNLCSGAYELSITDANNCEIILKDTLKNPSALPISLGNDRFVCTNQSIIYDISIPNMTGLFYQWNSSNGFSSYQSKVALSQAGTYYAQIKDVNGCISKDTLVLTASNASISNEFALPTQAFINEKIVVVNTSNPSADSVKWIFPSTAINIQQTAAFATFTLPDTGAFNLQFITYRGVCLAEQTKKVIVAKRSDLNSINTTRNPFIKTFSVSPNPTSGAFTVRVSLEDKASIQLKLINVITNNVSNLLYQSGSDSYVLPMNITVGAGTYILLLETPKGNASMKIIFL